MKQIKYPEDMNSTVSLANSVLKYFGAPVHHETLALLDRELAEREYENVVLLLLDGMGKCIIDGNLEPDGFFASHLAGTYSAVFPPTTVAATTSICSGLYPVEHCWLGWDCYYPKIDKTVTVFLNREAGTTKPAADYPVAKTLCPYQSLVEQIRENSGQAYSLIPFEEPYPGTFEEISDGIERLTKRPGKKYIYAYWPEPDGCMHEKGCYSPEAKETLRQLEKQVQELTEKLSNTLVIVTADHGHMDSRGVAIEDYPKITECLKRGLSLEPRAVNFFVKEEKKQQFEEEFRKNFGDTFLLLTKEEVREEQLFGPGKEGAAFDGMLGDYLAAAVSDLSIYSHKKEADFFIGVHAGLLEDEMMIPLLLIGSGKSPAYIA